MNENKFDFVFEDIIGLSRRCKFTNCTHTKEPHCAVKKAISEGVLSKDKFDVYFRENKGC